MMAEVETRFGATCPMRACQGIIDFDQHGSCLRLYLSRAVVIRLGSLRFIFNDKSTRRPRWKLTTRSWLCNQLEYTNMCPTSHLDSIGSNEHITTQDADGKKLHVYFSSYKLPLKARTTARHSSNVGRGP